jgi:acyl-CoA synthetase (AMP-forming)/AMP-acid ligase II
MTRCRLCSTDGVDLSVLRNRRQVVYGGAPLSTDELQKVADGRRDGVAQGELWVRAGTVVTDYADSNGWCHTGDVVRRDQGGFLYHSGRLDRQINCSGYYIYPGEIEEAILAISGIRQVRVIGKDISPWGITLVAELIPEQQQLTDGE